MNTESPTPTACPPSTPSVASPDIASAVNHQPSTNFNVSEAPHSSLLQSLVETLGNYVVLPPHAAETLALWILHTYAFHLRDVSTYLGIESPEKRCGKTTLLTVLSELCNRAIVASNISSPAFFRVIEETRPTLLIDEADTFLQTNDELRGILNSGYTKKTAHVIRVVNERRDEHREPRHLTIGGQPTGRALRVPNMVTTRPSQEGRGARGEGSNSSSSTHRSTDSLTHDSVSSSSLLATLHSSLATFSTWCPKAIAAIGHLPETLADRCIVIRMQRKTWQEQTQRLRNLQTNNLRAQCEAFVATHASEIANAQPEIPQALNDRAADIWEPLLVLADIAGGDWPTKARQAAIALSASSQETNPIGALLMDILLTFGEKQTDRLHTRDIVDYLQHRFGIRPWNENLKKPITDLWLAQQLRPYGIRPKSLRIQGIQAKGYVKDEMHDAFRRYIPKSEIDRIHEEFTMNQGELNHETAANSTTPNQNVVT